MMTVTLPADLRPWRAGDDIHIADDLAKSLMASGEAKDMRPFQPAGKTYEDRAMRPGDGRKGYKTKGAQA